MMDHKLLSLSWDAYEKNICSGLSLLQQREEFVDMTLAADGHHVKVHQMVLSLVSPFIKELITSANCLHPVLFLNRVSYSTLQSILEYAYTGEVMVAPDNLTCFLEACKDLHIKGLEDLNMQGDGQDFLHAIDARNSKDLEDTFEQSDSLLVERPARTGIKRKRTLKFKVDYDEHEQEYSHNNELENHYVEIEPYKAGSRWFCRDEYYYVVQRTKGPTMYLRCASDKCPAHWTLSKKRGAGPVLDIHNHAPTPWIPNRNAMFQALRNRTKSESIPLNAIYEQEAIRFHAAAPYLPFESVVPSMRKWRRNAQVAALRTPEPTDKTCMEFTIKSSPDSPPTMEVP